MKRGRMDANSTCKAFPNGLLPNKSPLPSLPVRHFLCFMKRKLSYSSIAKDAGSDMDTPDAAAHDKKVR